MPRFAGKKTTAFPVEFDGTYTEGDVDATMTGLVFLGEKPGSTAYPVQLDADGFLRAVVEGGIPLGTEYSDGAVNTASRGTLIMGDDGANIQNVLVDSSGRLQVEVVEGQYDGVQYQDGATVAAPYGFVAMGHDGSDVFPLLVDSTGHLQVDVVSLPALPAGTNNIGDVDIASALPAGANTVGAVKIDGVLKQGWSQVAININSATTTALKAGVSGHTYTVLTISLTVAAENNLTWKSNTTALSGPMDFGASGEPHGWQANLWPCGLKCAVDETLNLTTTTTGQVSGFITVLDES